MNEHTSKVKSSAVSDHRKSAGYHVVSHPGLIQIKGSDRIDFLQRQTTNDLRSLSDASHLVTVLTSPTARIIDVLTVYVVDDSTLGVLTLQGRAEQTTTFFKQRIFFQDDVQVENTSNAVLVIESYDPGVSHLLQTDQNLKELADYHAPVARMLNSDISAHPVWRLVLPADAGESFFELMSDLGVSEITDHEAEIQRIERGTPGTSDLTDDYTPLEMNLRYAVADGKGCYTGQEVLARQITYDKVTRTLIGLELASQTRVGSDVMHDDKTVGTLTSVIESPEFGWIGLAVIAAKHALAGAHLLVLDEGRETKAVVCDLPFRS